ncbi:Ldh family oxidoreductase [Amycolatopsis sp. NPDC098790]|uniref:Ldh family oxidoreductase n=1 Tax=Amycolatopsis sp. NPDC098790 TaxID=3363939 RepID=UPI003815D796
MTDPGLRYIGAHELSRFTGAALRAAGARPADAEVTADVLVAADLGGVESHGVARLRRYVEGLRDGSIDRDAVPEVIRDTGGTCIVDAHNGLGQPALRTAVDLAAERARTTGVSVALVRRSNHMGIAGWFAERAARAGTFAVVATNAVPQVAPMDVREPMFGTNPLSYAVPTSDGPICFDGATSVVSRGKLEQLGRTGGSMRTGWALDPTGRPATDVLGTVDGLIGRDGHALLPVGGGRPEHGGHKGSGFALLVELLCGPLAGARWSRHTYEDGEAGVGHFVLCLDLGALGDPAEVDAELAGLAREIRDGRPVDVAKPPRLPGDRRRRLAERRRTYGVPVLESVVNDLRDIATRLGIQPPSPANYDIPAVTAPR